MPIPDYQTLMLPVLRVIGDDREHSPHEVMTQLAEQFHLTEAEREQLPAQRACPSAEQPDPLGGDLHAARRAGEESRAGPCGEPATRVGSCSRTRLNALTSPTSAAIQGSSSGIKQQRAEVIRRPHPRSRPRNRDLSETPEEALERIWGAIRDQVASELLETIKSGTSQFFERLVVRLLVAMGYGGSYAEAAEVIGRSGDAGIDGLIKEDRLGLDTVYVQAKKWDGPVGRPRSEVRRQSGGRAGAKRGSSLQRRRLAPRPATTSRGSTSGSLSSTG